jgi:D-alanyl-lipoteichoic acid acyltransferase DltB (MBOAT superfamily)
LLHQFYEKHPFDYNNLKGGLQLMLWGLFKKIVIADRLSIYVNAVYNHPDHHTGITLLLATVFFAFQIYCDFSGYSDIAIGAARTMGFKLMTNFNHPYFSKTISEFWKRWHISLSTWFKDYLYISMGGNRVSVPRMYFNLFIVFLVSGLWHGADWTFIIWGALNGFYLVFALYTSPLKNKVAVITGFNKIPAFTGFLQILLTFSLTSFAWIFFRASTLTDAVTIIKRIFTVRGPVFYENPSQLIYSFFGIIFLLLVESKNEYYTGNISFFHSKHWLVRNLSYAALVILILLIGVFDGGQFIYFQF